MGRNKGDKRVKGFFFSFFVLKVVQEVGSQCSNTEGLNGSCSPIIQRKLELDKVCVCRYLSLYIITSLCSSNCPCGLSE